jgi:hypothetical protein
VKIPNEQQKRELAELLNTKVFAYLEESRAELIDELILSTELDLTRSLQGRILEISEFIGFIRKAHKDLTEGSVNRENTKFQC